jgi:cytochrome c biogenesis protein CcmG/thiol:disulfide interchange protein DsbE
MSNRPSSTKSGHKSGGSGSARVDEARQAASGAGGTRWFIVVVIAVVVVGALGIAVFASKRDQEAVKTQGVASAGFDLGENAEPDLVTAEVKVTGDPVPDAPSASADNPNPTDEGVGKPAPTLVGQRFDGNPIAITGPGRPKVLIFVAHWCPHCQKEVPLITEHLGGKLPDDVDLYAVSTGVAEAKGNYPPGAWLRKANWPIQTLVDDDKGSAARAYGLSGYPFMVAVDAAGNVVARTSGEVTMDQFDDLLAKARTNPVSTSGTV